jgi:hypothetical protein
MGFWDDMLLLSNLQGEVDVAIGPVSYPGLSSGLFAASPTGKPARSVFRVLHRHASSTLMEVSGQQPAGSSKTTHSVLHDPALVVRMAACMVNSLLLSCIQLEHVLHGQACVMCFFNMVAIIVQCLTEAPVFHCRLLS